MVEDIQLRKFKCFKDARQLYDFLYGGCMQALDIVADLENVEGLTVPPIIHPDNPVRDYCDFSVLWDKKMYPRQLSEYINTELGIKNKSEFIEYWYDEWDNLYLNEHTREGRKFLRWLNRKFPGVSYPDYCILIGE